MNPIGPAKIAVAIDSESGDHISDPSPASLPPNPKENPILVHIMSELTPTTSSRAALLNEDEDALSDRFEQVLEEVFRRYAVKNGGGEPTPEDNVDQLSLRKKELDAFSEATNGAGE